MAYAITSYKCQGDSLNEVIIDYAGSEREKRNIPKGSFYVGLTRVGEGRNVYLKSFDKSYITFNKKVENKIASMRKTKPYKFLKIYLHESIFKDDFEVKLGYFNINGLMESNHANYLNSDQNLKNLDFLVIAETWLTSKVSDELIEKKLTNWSVVKRFDSTDCTKHMGLLLLSSKKSTKCNIIWSLEIF